jgi:hypothetical protein
MATAFVEAGGAALASGASIGTAAAIGTVAAAGEATAVAGAAIGAGIIGSSLYVGGRVVSNTLRGRDGEEDAPRPAPGARGPRGTTPAKPPALTNEQAFDRATQARDEELARVSGLSAKERGQSTMTVGVCDPVTGKCAAATKFTGATDPNDCAEDVARKKLLEQVPDADPSRFRYATPIRPRTGKPRPVCLRCQSRGLNEENFAPGTEFDRPPNTPHPGKQQFI